MLSITHVTEDIRQVSVVRSIPVIGSKFSGPNFFLDTQNYKYWSVMQPLSPEEIRIQSALLKEYNSGNS